MKRKDGQVLARYLVEVNKAYLQTSTRTNRQHALLLLPVAGLLVFLTYLIIRAVG